VPHRRDLTDSPLLARVRRPRVALPLLVAVPLPIAVALVLTSRPVYPGDACYYGAPRASLRATDHYLALMTPLAMFGLVAVALLALPIRGRWKLLVGAAAAWAVVALVWTDAARPVMVYGANMAVFGVFLGVPLLAIVGVAGRESSWVRAIGWFEFLYLLPLLLGLAGLLAQPRCFAGNPPAPLR
jgi:hypothetical protein